MSSIDGIGSGLSSALEQLRANLFKSIDTNNDGSISKSELETAVTKNGGTKAAADALYAQLDPSNTGGISESTFGSSLPPPPFSSGVGSVLLADQSQQSTGSAASSSNPLADQLFQQLTGGSGTLTQSELEQSVTKAGGTKASADALWKQLDPNGTGSVSEQQFAQSLPPPPPPPGGFDSSGASGGASGGTSAQDAILALLQGSGGTDGTASSSSDGGSSAQDALLALLQGGTSGTGSTTPSTDSAQAAIASLLKAFQPEQATG